MIISFIAYSLCRIKVEGNEPQKQSRRLNDGESLKIMNGLNNRNDKKQKVKKRKLMGGILYGLGTGAIGAGLMATKASYQENQIKLLMNKLGTQSTMIDSRLGIQRATLSDIKSRIQSAVNGFDNYSKNLKDHISQFTRFVEAKLKFAGVLNAGHTLKPIKSSP